ncbi:MAG: tRNA 2-thiocytidine biosynthesis protein TtcA [Clostridia bacterium]|nr:tRNA 2-thiocytidine biosynthesis protein TtcA [Clostridia bacterium]
MEEEIKEEKKKKEYKPYELIEQSIQKRFRKEIWKKFISAINEFEMINEGDKIAVCISGGKDSMLLAKCIQEIKKHGRVNFEAVYLVMDPGYNEKNRKKIEENAKLMNIPVTIFESDIFNSVEHIEDSPCYLCARMRRGCLYSKAKELGCNKIALGHHFDDVIETIMMGMLYGAQFQTMMPKINSTNFEGMELIRPLYLVKEEDILKWRDYNNLSFIRCACRFTENIEEYDNGESNSKRFEMKKLISELRKINPKVDMNIFRSTYNVNLNTVISYTKDDECVHFLDTYEEERKKKDLKRKEKENNN